MTETTTLSNEQQAVLDAVAAGEDVIVDATVGSGKTTAIQALCAGLGDERNVLYLTYSRLLKLDAQRRVGRAKVQNYHGIVYPALRQAEISCGLGESIGVFNKNFRHLSAGFPRYDVIVVDEYQDINEEYALLLRNIKSLNPLMQVVMVGDLAQKVRSDTTLDVQGFVSEFCESPALLPFTQSFRVGPQMADMLSQAWNKPVIGANKDQVVRTMTEVEAIDYISSQRTGDLLCLGKRDGQMSKVLNVLEKEKPEVFNKRTVYASIKDGDSRVDYSDEAAIFTTFDSAKGLERPISVVFDFDERHWEVRNGFAGADHEVLRNVFLVAASRGKSEVIFVKANKSRWWMFDRPDALGGVGIKSFTELPDKHRATYDKPKWASDCFDFTYAENLEACFELLDTQRLDDGESEIIEINRTDGLIDLSPVVGAYQEALFFQRYNADRELSKNPDEKAAAARSELGTDPWLNALVLASVDTAQERYVNQVDAKIPQEIREALINRLSTQLPRDAQIQQQLSIAGDAIHDRKTSTPFAINGVIDAIHEDVVFELKFTTELSHSMFLQLALYLVMGGYEAGVLWNVRTNERWQVKVPDAQRFMNAALLCITKQDYRVFEFESKELADDDALDQVA